MISHPHHATLPILFCFLGSFFFSNVICFTAFPLSLLFSIGLITARLICRENTLADFFSFFNCHFFVKVAAWVSFVNIKKGSEATVQL